MWHVWGGQEGCVHVFGGETEGKGHLEGLGFGERVILKRIFKK